jgi:hypothetical protein
MEGADLLARAGNLFVLNLQGLFGLVTGDVVGVPDYWLASCFGMLAEKLQGGEGRESAAGPAFAANGSQSGMSGRNLALY